MLTLILGGARSGKSDLAVRLGRLHDGPVVFVATMEGADGETRARIAAHRSERPAAWRTIEEPLYAVEALRDAAPPGALVLFDCLTLWISNALLAATPDPDAASPAAMEAGVAAALARVGDLLDWQAESACDLAVVSNEVGMGVVPAYPLGRAFRDALGAANRLVAARADRVYYLVAGLVLDARALGAVPLEAWTEAAADDPDPR
ncbi:MAG TPA: bifunctional adenosylcobinamide kinase/adenosylcobinamide-phosphate guanylyltransferase [Dehalococcoidia bacterium]|nr:bifunctional adenosylcobinamide kinase/adenosylcobinamide-phosphate guanylyltransferase [Dehalococcoidia bacterium]